MHITFYTKTIKGFFHMNAQLNDTLDLEYGLFTQGAAVWFSLL
jgi:hypothetical protein